MSRTNHARAEYEARRAHDTQKYRQQIEARDNRRIAREQVREFADLWYVWLVMFAA